MNTVLPVSHDIVRIFAPEGMRKRALEGKHRFLNTVEHELDSAGFTVEFCEDSVLEQYSDTTSQGYSLFNKLEPLDEKGLTFRKNYFDPFWKIEASNARWTWPIVSKQFDEPLAKRERIMRFAETLRRRHLSTVSGSASVDDFVFIPLQGRLLVQRSFQTISPIQMLSTVARHMKNQQIVATYHPGENYTDQEREELANVCMKHPNVTISERKASDLIEKCSCVISENSSVTLLAYLLHKPCALFAEIDFHHIALKANVSDFSQTIAELANYKADYDGYLWWFFQEQSINSSKPDAGKKIRNTLRRHGWTI